MKDVSRFVLSLAPALVLGIIAGDAALQTAGFHALQRFLILVLTGLAAEALVWQIARQE